MNLLQRIKDSASRVTEKAQSSVEIGKLNGHISDIEHEMDVEFLKMGKLFYEGYRTRDMSVAEGKMVEHSRVCSRLQEKIDALRSRIAELKNERLCTCGNVVALDANFCPNCGNKLEERSSVRQTSPAPAPAPTPSYFKEEDEHEDQYFGEDELTEAERELALKPDIHVDYAEVPEPDDELPLEKYADIVQDDEMDRRHADELERERERQLELDRRIRDWKASEHEEAEEGGEPGVRDVVKCQICRADLAKGSMWCPRCGAEQI